MMKMRKRIKPLFVYLFFAFLAGILVISQIYTNHVRQATLEQAKKQIPETPKPKKVTQKKKNTEKETFVLNPIIDLSGWQLPSEIDYDVLASNISGAIIRIQGGSGINFHNNAAHKSGTDKSFKTHIKEFQKRNVPVAVYAYVRGSSVKEMKKEAQTFYKSASPYKPTFYWIDVEEKTMSNMDKGISAFRKELKRLGAKNIGIYIGTYFMEEHGISTDGFDAVWIPTYGSDSGYYEQAPTTDLDYDLHQYTSKGYLNGFNGPLDLNQIAITKDAEKTYQKLFSVSN